MLWKISNVRLGLDEPEANLPQRLADDLGISPTAIGRLRILRKSLDARRHDDIHFVYAAEIDLADEQPPIRKAEGVQVAPFQEATFDWPEPGTEPLSSRPVIVGAGPAGLFAAYFLALSRYHPLVLER